MKKVNLLLLFCCGWLASVSAQSTANFFKPVSETAIALRGTAPRLDLPKAYTTYQLDLPALQNVLQSAPWEFTPAARQHSCTIALPMSDGTMEAFSVWQVAIMAPELAAKAPYIHTYGGESLQTPGKTIRFSTTARGFRAIVVGSELGIDYVEPYSWGQQEYYLVFDRTALPGDPLRHLTTGVLGGSTPALAPDEHPYAPPVEDRGLLVEPVKLRIFRYAAATTGEFAQDHGGTAESVLSAVVEYTNMVSATYERDINMRLQLVGNNDKVIYLDPATDPYNGLEVGDWMSQNPTIINSKIGSSNYDLAHVYARYIQGGAIGVAGAIGNTCTANKAAGCSAGNGNGDYGDGFLNVIGQEVGHQTGGGHTWNRCAGGGGRQGNTAFEPGSGSTIMSYAGACGADNVQGNSDLYYHSGSIEEIKIYYLTGQGTCGSNITTDNHPPEVVLPYQDGFFIPISTPFELNGSATDSDGDALSYCWEEMDAGPETPLGTPSGNAAIFRTRPPVLVTNRYFPRLNTVLANGSDITEQLPTYSRDMTFRLTARDNRLNGGGVGWKDVSFQAFGGAGPFTVVYPNVSTTTWRVGEYVNVTWNVANSDKSPVNCKKVNIRLSTNGGQGFPIMLAENVDNDGSQIVQVPSNLGPLARVRIDAVDNVFFDISNQNFKILLPTQPGVSFGLASDGAKLCLPNTFSTSVLTAGISGYSTLISLDIVSGLPTGATANFSATTINPGELPSLTIDLNGVSLEGTYVINVRAITGADTIIRPVTLQLTTNDFSQLALLTPADGSTGLAQTQSLHWQTVPDADAYEIELATSPSFEASTIVYTKTNWTQDVLNVPTFLQKGQAYYWHVRPVNECSPHAWTQPAFFATFVENCQVYTANDLPKNISANSTPTVESKITINAGGTFNSLNIKQVKGNHQFFKDLEFHLLSPTGTDVLLLNEKCGNYSGSFNFSINDAAPANFPCPPPNNGTAYKATNALTPFSGQNSTGVWMLRVKDNVIGSSGQLSGFELEFCSSVSLSPPFLVNNNVLNLAPGTNQAVSADLLLVEDANNVHGQLLFTLVTVPQHGELQKNFGGVLHPGDQFTQADLDAGVLRYFSYGNTPQDEFRFTVTDGEGGFLATPKFLIQPVVGTREASLDGPAFGLFPNPATETVWVALDQPAASTLQVNVFNVNGQLMQRAQLAMGANRLPIPVNNLPKGIYMVRVESAAGAGIRKLIVE